MEKAGDPEKHGLLAEIEIRKNWMSCEKPLHDVPMPCPLGTVFHGARLRKLGGEDEGPSQE